MLKKGVAGKTKHCNKCDTEKDLHFFSKHKDNRDGLQYQCKACQKSRLKDYSSQGTRTVWAVSAPCSKETYNKLKGLLATIDLRRFLRLAKSRREDGVSFDGRIRVAQ